MKKASSNASSLQKFQKQALWLAFLLAFLFHIALVAAVVTAGSGKPKPEFRTLAVMNFSHYDPLGGEPGGSDNDELTESPASTEPEQEPEAITEPVPEPEEPAPALVKSISEKAAPLTEPPPEKVKKKENQKEAKKPKKTTKPSKTANADKNGNGNPASPAPGGSPGTGSGGVGGGSGKGNPNADKAYGAKIQKKLQRYKKYPPSARSQKIEGVVTVNFTLDRNGQVISSRLAKSSGHAALDEEVMALLKRCSPFPAMPKEITRDTFNITVPIKFSLR